MSRKRRWMIAVVLAAAALAALVISPGGQRMCVRVGLAYAARRLHLPVRVNAVEPALLRKRVTLRGIAVGELVRAESLVVSWDWLPLLTGQLRLAGVHAEKVTIDLAAPWPQSGSKEPPPLRIDRLEVRNLKVIGLPRVAGWIEIDHFTGGFASGLPRGELTGVIRLQNPVHVNPLAPVTLTARLGQGASSPWSFALHSDDLDVSGEGKFTARPWRLEGDCRGAAPLELLTLGTRGRVTWTSRVTFDTTGLRAEWDARAPEVVTGKLRARDFTARGQTDLKGWKLLQARFLLPGGAVQLQGEGHYDPPAAELRVNAAGFNLAAFVPQLPAAVALQWTGELRLKLDPRALQLEGGGRATLLHRGQPLMTGPMNITTRDHAPQVRAELGGAGGTVHIEPAAGRYQLHGSFAGPGLEMIRSLAQGSLPLRLQLQAASFTGEADPRVPLYTGSLTGSGTVQGQPAGVKSRLKISAREWTAEGLEMTLGGGSFKGRAGGALGFTWPLLPAAPFKFAPSQGPAAAARRSVRAEKITRRHDQLFRRPHADYRRANLRRTRRQARRPAILFIAQKPARRAPAPRSPAKAASLPQGELEGTLDNVPLAALAPDAFSGWEIDGKLSGRIHYRGESLEADLTLVDGRVHGVMLPPLRITAAGTRGRWHFRATDAGGLYEITGTGPRDFNLRGRLPLDLALLLPPGQRPKNSTLAGEAELFIRSRPGGEAEIAGEFTIPELTLAGKNFGAALFALGGRLRHPEVSLRLADSGIIAQTRLDLKAGRFTGLAHLFEAKLTVKAVGKPLEAPLTGSFTLAGETAAPLAGIAGGWLDAADVQWHNARLRSHAALLMPGSGHAELPLRLRGNLASADGRLGIDRARGVSLTLATTGRAALIAALVDDLYLDGQVSGDLRMGFPWSGPSRAAGEWQVIDAVLGWSNFPVAISSGSGRARLVNKQLYLEDLAFLTEGGRGTGAARFDFGEHGVERFTAGIKADSTRLGFIPGLSASADADLKLKYGWDSGWTIGGTAAILNGRLLTPGLEFTSVLTPVKSEGGRTPVNLDLQLTTAGGLDVTSSLYRVSMQGGLHLTGDLSDPQAAGHLEGLQGGRLRFRDRQYAITRVTVDFTGQDLSQGALDLEAESTVRGYRIILAATGPLQNPSIDFRSDPSLDLQNIVTLLLTGKTQDELTAQGIVPSNELIALYLTNQAISAGGEAGLNRYVEYIALTPGLDASRGLAAPSLTLGRNFGDRFSSLVRLDLNGANYSAEGEYALSRKLRLSLSKSSLIGGIGGDLRFFTPFDFDKTLGAAPSGPTAPLGEVTLDGLPAADPLAGLPRRELPAGKPAVRRKILKVTESLRQALRRRGNFIARITTDEKLRDGRLDLHFIVAPGPVIRITVSEGGTPRKDLEKKLTRLDLDVPFLDAFTARAKLALDQALAESGRAGRDIAVSRSGDDPVILAFVITREAELTVSTPARSEWPKTPPGAPAARLFFPSLRFGLRFSPRLGLHGRYNALVLGEEKARYLNALSSAGYFDARLEIEPEIRGSRVKLHFFLEPGPRAVTGAIEFSGDQSPVPPEKLPVKMGKPLTGKALEESKKMILGEYFHSGYRAATARWRTKIAPDGNATVIFELNPGAASVTGPVTITGLKHTRESVVRSRIRFKSGEPLDPRALDETRTALYRSGVFDHVTITAPAAPTDAQAPVSTAVEVVVGERQRFVIGASLGYDSEERLRESLQLGDTNFLGRAHTLSLSVKNSSLEQRFDLSYRDPDLFGWKLDLTGTARYQFQRTDSFDLYRRGVDLRFTRILSPRLSLQAVAALTRVNFGEIRVDPTYQQLRRFSVPSLGAAIIYNSRDEALNPHRGDLLSLGLQFAAPIFGGGDTRFTKLNATVYHYRPLGGGVWAQGFRAGHIINQSSTKVPLSERFYAGGDGSMRGFQRDKLGPLDPLTGNPVGGLGQLLLNEELRFPLGSSRRFNFSLFLDAGNVDERGFSLRDLRASYGAGLFYLSPIGPLRFEYGRQFSPRANEPAGVFHFAIGRAF